MEHTQNKIPDPKELEKELNEYLQNKYGGHIKLALPGLFLFLTLTRGSLPTPLANCVHARSGAYYMF